MQTPGRQTQPQTPMIPVERMMDLAYDRVLSRVTEENQDIQRPQIKVFGRVISQLEMMSGNMREMSNQIRQDISAKRTYYREELKILKKDSENLQSANTKLFSGTRKTLAGAAGALGVAQASAGNIGGAVQSFGGAAALMSPEIIQLLTGSIVNSLALKGIVGNRGVGGTAGRLAGASRMKNPLLMTAMLAASFLLPSLANAGQSSDKRRQELATKVISGDQTINKPDVSRFRNQLNRFDRILSSVSLDRKKSNQDTINPEDFKKEENPIAKGIQDFFNPKKKEKEKVTEERKVEENLTNEVTNEVTNIEGETNLNISSNIEGDTIEGDTIEGDIASTISLVNNLTENSIFNDEISNIISSNEDLASNLLPNLDISQMGKQILSSETSNNVIDLSSPQQEQPAPSGFSGNAAKSASISVATKFVSGGGTIDKFEAASSLRSYGAYS